MPVYYKFFKPGTQETVPLDTVDKWIAEKCGETYNPRRYCYSFQPIIEALSFVNGGSHQRITQEVWLTSNDWFRLIDEGMQMMADILADLLQLYDFEAWYSHIK